MAIFTEQQICNYQEPPSPTGSGPSQETCHATPRHPRQPGGAVRSGLRIGNPTVPPELPLLLDKVYPINEIVRVDYFLPGCPPSGDTIRKFLTDLLTGRTPRIERPLLKFD